MIFTNIFWMLAILFSILTLIRYKISITEIEKQKLEEHPYIDEANITVLQPILGGDPALEYCLEKNLLNAPNGHFIWLLDSNDEEGQSAAKQAIIASGRDDVVMIIAPPPPEGFNPKTYKLSAGLCRTKTKYMAVLDDDTILPVGTLGRGAAWAEEGTLVTGLPTYASRHNFGSLLVSGFVNANAIMTYLPTASVKLTKTINGMFSLMRREDIINRGGFDAFINEVTDDYALAQLFLSKAGRIKQTSLHLSIITSVDNVQHYFALMRRWIVFAKLYLRENISFGIIFLVLLPGILSFPLFLTGLISGTQTMLIAVLLLIIKGLLIRDLNKRLQVNSLRWYDIMFQILAELLLPLHIVTASLKPDHIRWRKRNFVLHGRSIIDG